MKRTLEERAAEDLYRAIIIVEHFLDCDELWYSPKVEIADEAEPLSDDGKFDFPRHV